MSAPFKGEKTVNTYDYEENTHDHFEQENNSSEDEPFTEPTEELGTTTLDDVHESSLIVGEIKEPHEDLGSLNSTLPDDSPQESPEVTSIPCNAPEPSML